MAIPLSLWRMASKTPDLPTVTFPAIEHHRPLAGAKVYCLMTEARVCVNILPLVVTWKWNGQESNLWPVGHKSVTWRLMNLLIYVTCLLCFRDCIEFLSSEGHIYSTIDDEHYKPTDSWYVTFLVVKIQCLSSVPVFGQLFGCDHA